MRKLQLVTGKDKTESRFEYIQVKNGFVYATNKFILVKFPVADVFGEGIYDDILDETVPVISEKEELYFYSPSWASAKMDKAHTIGREGNLFCAFDKNGNQIGHITAIEKLPDDLRYPNAEVVIPTDDSVTAELNSISFIPEMLLDLCKAFGQKSGYFTYTFYGRDRAILVKHSDTDGLGLIYPIYTPQ